MAQPAAAENVRVLSGEHPGFTRLAFVFDGPTEWRFGRVDAPAGDDEADGATASRLYELRLTRGDVDLDISRVFSRVPRTRLQGLAAQESRLRLTVAAGHRAVPFDLREGVMAIDIRPGPPPPNSPFEEPLPPQDAPPAQADAAATRDASFSAGARADVTGAAPDAFAWSDYLMQRLEPAEAAPRGARRQETDATAASPFASLPRTDGGQDIGPQIGPASARNEGRSAVNRDKMSLWASHAGARLTADPGAADAPGPGRPQRPESGFLPAGKGDADGLAQAQALILEQVARAAAQGLVTAARTDLPDLSASGPASDATEPPADPEAPVPPERQPEAPSTDAQINVTAQTSIDRDGFARVRRALQGAPDACLTSMDLDLDVEAWGRGQEPARMIAEGRVALLGEFDRVRPDAVESLARSYIHLGFGAEAEALIRTFPDGVGDAGRLLALAAIMDDRLPDADAPLSGLTHCDSAAALWALLSGPPGAPAPDLNVAAVRRSFSALPGHLRAHLAPAVADRLIALGRIDAAAAVRNAVARVAGPSDMRTEFLEARLALEAGAAGQDAFPQVEERLLSVIAHDGPDRIPALLLYLEGRLERGLPVTREFAMQTGALAFEYRNAPEGPALRRAEILALAASGDFEAAFAALARARPGPAIASDGAQPAAPDVLSRLYDLVAEQAPDIAFLRRALAIEPAALGAMRPETVSRLSNRLLALGFPAEAQRVRRGGAGDEASHLFVAKAALALGRPRAALQEIAGLGGASANRVRAGALAELGEAVEAIRLYAVVGDHDAAARTAWVAGDWAAYRRLRQDARSDALQRLGAASLPGGGDASVRQNLTGGPRGSVRPPDIEAGAPTMAGDALGAGQGAQQSLAPGGGGAASEPGGVLARNRELLDKSRETRAALADLRATLPAVKPGL